MTVTVNIGGDSKAWQAIVTGTKLSDLIVTGTVQPGSGSQHDRTAGDRVPVHQPRPGPVQHASRKP